MAGQDGEGTFGVSHLSDLPITLSFGAVLILVLLLLVVLRIAFGSITVTGGAK